MSATPMIRCQCYACQGSGTKLGDPDRRACTVCHGRGILHLFPTPIEREIARRKAIDEVCTNAGL